MMKQPEIKLLKIQGESRAIFKETQQYNKREYEHERETTRTKEVVGYA